MILADTSVWIDHLRNSDAGLSRLLLDGAILTHPFVIGEIALGSLRQREIVLGSLRDLPRATPADDDEVARFIEQQQLFGCGIGYVDAHLLASVKLTPGASLWTRDRRLDDIAKRLGAVHTAQH